jgi:hypothetical protein
MRGKKRAGGKGLQTWTRRGADEHVSSVKVTNSDASGVGCWSSSGKDTWLMLGSNGKTTWLDWSIQMKMVCGISITV